MFPNMRLCQGGKLRSLAVVDKVILDVDDRPGTEFYGEPVKLLLGRVTRRFDVLVEAVMIRIHAAGLPVPDLVNPRKTGFKQGAFCSRVVDETVLAILQDWP